jgi:hypothetical protein
MAILDTRVTPARFSWHVEFGVSCPDENPFNSLMFFAAANRGGGKMEIGFDEALSAAVKSPARAPSVGISYYV